MNPMPLVLMYHSINYRFDDPYLITVSPARFEEQMQWIRDRGYRGVGMAELLEAQSTGSAANLVALTFDDGYADFLTRAVPVLVRMGFTASVFMVAGRVGSTNTWDEGPRKPLMTADQLRTVAGYGMEVGSHGHQHLSLPSVDDGDLDQELKRSRAELEEILDGPVTGFAYPYGDVTPREIDAVKAAGYDYACAIWGDHAGPHALPRTYIGEPDRRLRLRAKVVRHRLRWRKHA
ncbi:polysaccharide deacetylase family protein [Spirillospora sp. CA-294931]|uniref:polysaccharide deacetylase family protein n=1 Tax=Spirillospora sp. CA-294931 TaxID=3240042 RepID=UPI003D8F8938